MKNTETPGSRIRALRSQFKLTQAELARIAKVSAPNVTAWEKDSYLPKTDPLKFMSQFFGVTEDYILCKSNELDDSLQAKLNNFSLHKRLIESRESAQKTQEEVAAAVGISLTKYQDLESGNTKKSAFIPMIAKFLDVDGLWLTTGEKADSFSDKGILKPVVVTEDSNEFIWIDVVEAKFSCGTGEDIEFHFDVVNGKLPFPPTFFKNKGVVPECMKIITATGDSMADFIKDGDYVGIDISQTGVIDGEIYAVYFAGEGMLKQIFKEADGSLVLHSHNQKYRDRIVSEDNGHNFRVMGRQFWRAG